MFMEKVHTCSIQCWKHIKVLLHEEKTATNEIYVLLCLTFYGRIASCYKLNTVIFLKIRTPNFNK